MSKSKLYNSFESKNRGTPLIKCLTECKEGEEVTVKRVNCGFKAKRRLAQLGLVPRVKIKKIKAAPFRGPLEIIVKGANLVLGRGLADKVIVECKNDCYF